MFIVLTPISPSTLPDTALTCTSYHVSGSAEKKQIIQHYQEEIVKRYLNSYFYIDFFKMKEQPISNKQEVTEKNLFTKSNLTTNIQYSVHH